MSRLTNWLRRQKVLPTKQELPEHLTVGRESYGFGAGSFSGIDKDSPVEIGSFCSIGPGVLFLCKANHRTDTVSTFPLETRFFGHNSRKGNMRYLQSKGPIRVGNDVWIGARATILSGITIGDGAIVAAGATVVEDVPPYTIVGGTPARVIKQRFDAETVRALLKIQWWDWPDTLLKRERAAFQLPAEEFARRYATPKLSIRDAS